MVSLGYRLAALVATPVLLWWARGSIDSAVVVAAAVAAALAVTHVWLFRRALRGDGTGRLQSTWFAIVDPVVAAMLLLGTGIAFRGEGWVLSPLRNPAWLYAQGTVVLAAGRGRRHGGAAALLAAVLAAVLAWIGGSSIARESVPAQISMILPALLVGAAFWLTREGAREAAREGLRAGREAERARHLRAMHDTVLQTLEAVAARLDRSDATTDESIAEVRHAIRSQAVSLRSELRRADEELGALQDELEARLARCATRTHIETEFNRLGEVPALAPAKMDALLGAFGETLRNVEQHAEARRVTVLLSADDSVVRIVVRDDGKGFDPQNVRIGAFGIRESIVGRLEAVEGGVTIDSAIGAGTRAELWVVP